MSYSPKNLTSLGLLGITAEIRKEIMLSLTVNDYSSGPEADQNFSGEICKFGITVGDKQVYIKLKIEDQKHRKVAKCLSFHIADHDIYYPYK